jgi:hypothetical protein
VTDGSSRPSAAGSSSHPEPDTGRSLLAPQIRWNERTRLRGSTGRPVLVVKTSPLSSHARPKPWLQAGKYVSALAIDLPKRQRGEDRPAPWGIARSGGPVAA